MIHIIMQTIHTAVIYNIWQNCDINMPRIRSYKTEKMAIPVQLAIKVKFELKFSVTYFTV